MKSELANKLKEILDNMSQEQFDLEWSKITALELEGPSFTDAIEYITMSVGQVGKFELNSVAPTSIEYDSNLALAA